MLTPHIKEITEYHQYDLDVTDHVLIRYSAFVRNCKKKCEYNGNVLQLLIDLEKAHDSDRTEAKSA
jgi:hypothetical protein